ncbi:hypothetical protein BX616_008657 [Lobosporangium transversale]|uniref:Putative zinc finger in N-recognin-domain-containing protein n=1 Tax=Lobosporangium transversale TaxID=64571 RepID=A0A1Y2GBY8_9FUNG|nr:putative zinc finger in N-recognin-domain-containing protein [Lobosporangium transversale]KAF9914248.1 hypothetical protein BX616_008657 [Lobosporangium transversale]ORZ04807.1 putative zinc finger in N-recognin-domain-containing protein [Lobosporangium transversale]|eukprot:XP_021876744.1 putative zinc finger in N-recognin-domain-containing protein [Lobosporangium transversale]
MAEQDTITVSEYIAEQERLEKEARELFPKKFDICSNSMGYIRQPVYSCLTCNPNSGEEAGFCYSCSISCHGNHNLVELFTKRGFRCDCGTEKFKTIKCKLDPKPAESINELNKYNHNYLGKFCWCDIQYDPLKEESTMLQCVVCEDWFHDTCIGITPHNDDFDDFICRTCTRAHPFLRRYAQHPLFMIGLSEKNGDPKSVTMIDCSKNSGDAKGKATDKNGGQSTKAAEDEIISITDEDTTNKIPETNINTTIVSAITTTTTPATSTTTTTLTEIIESGTKGSNVVNHAKRPHDTTQEENTKNGKDTEETELSQNKRQKLDTEACKLHQQPSDAYPDQEMNLFATEGWRDILCQCTACMTLYTKEDVPFILGEEAIYEDEDDEEADTSMLESGMKKLSEMDRVQVMDGMLAYRKMRDEIRNFLAPFSEQGKVVTADDIQAFFTAKMEQRAASDDKPNTF